ncbi:DNA-binding protein VF530 [Kriegella sp. EG-1]|nr:DNA-binding protein VF530 [Flavobacteriaceae bacterium EG-1]
MKQTNNPLHNIKLLDMLEFLTEKYSWEDLAGQVDINCFKSNPSIKSSLKFLRKTPWARKKVEYLYLKSLHK